MWLTTVGHDTMGLMMRASHQSWFSIRSCFVHDSFFRMNKEQKRNDDPELKNKGRIHIHRVFAKLVHEFMAMAWLRVLAQALAFSGSASNFS
jgi:hypothetical protein